MLERTFSVYEFQALPYFLQTEKKVSDHKKAHCEQRKKPHYKPSNFQTEFRKVSYTKNALVISQFDKSEHNFKITQIFKKSDLNWMIKYRVVYVIR